MKAILQAILDEGAFRFLVQKKSSNLKSKISILENGIMFSVDEAITTYIQ